MTRHVEPVTLTDGNGLVVDVAACGGVVGPERVRVCVGRFYIYDFFFLFFGRIVWSMASLTRPQAPSSSAPGTQKRPLSGGATAAPAGPQPVESQVADAPTAV